MAIRKSDTMHVLIGNVQGSKVATVYLPCLKKQAIALALQSVALCSATSPKRRNGCSRKSADIRK
jgi:hypothetical protein